MFLEQPLASPGSAINSVGNVNYQALSNVPILALPSAHLLDQSLSYTCQPQGPLAGQSLGLWAGQPPGLSAGQPPGLSAGQPPGLSAGQPLGPSAGQLPGSQLPSPKVPPLSLPAPSSGRQMRRYQDSEIFLRNT